MSAACIESLQKQLDERTESLRQAVASIDRLTAERAPVFVVPPTPVTSQVYELQQQISDLEATATRLLGLKNNLRGEVLRLTCANQTLRDEVVALKARTLATPGDHEDMATLGRFFKRLVAHDRVRVSLEKFAIESRSWVRVEPSRHWSCNRYPSDSPLGQILLGLKK